MNKSKVAVAASAALGKIASVIGFILGICSLPIIIYGLSDLGANGAIPAVVMLLVVFMFSVFLVIKGAQIKRRIKRFRCYVALISEQQMTSIDDIAASTSKSVQFVSNDLLLMVRRKFFSNASINTLSNEIIIGATAKPAEPTGSPVGAAPPGQPTTQSTPHCDWVVYKCSGCGASGAKHNGAPGICEYCGSVN